MARSTCSVPGCANLVNGHGLCQKHQCRLNKYGTLDGGSTTHAPPDVRFARRTEYDLNGGCWLWSGSHHTRTGYGSFQPGGHGSPTTSAHRFSYELYKGSIPDGLVVMHKCDVTLCVNPDHLTLGTYSENMQDMHRKGRSGRTRKPKAAASPRPRGEQLYNALLSDERVRFIKSHPEISDADFALMFGVTSQAIYLVRIGKNWSHIT